MVVTTVVVTTNVMQDVEPRVSSCSHLLPKYSRSELNTKGTIYQVRGSLIADQEQVGRMMNSGVDLRKVTGGRQKHHKTEPNKTCLQTYSIHNPQT